MSANPRIEDLTRLRVLYRHRGPRDGRTGITPEGDIGAPWRYNLAGAVLDAQRVMEMDDPTLNRWREGMGLAEPVAQQPAPITAPSAWSDQCSARGPGLSHAHWDKCVSKKGGHPGTGDIHLAGQCCHCTGTI